MNEKRHSNYRQPAFPGWRFTDSGGRMIENLGGLLKAQKLLDDSLSREFGTDYWTILVSHGYTLALADEIGEWLHEIKEEWCWWKKNQRPANRQKELGEFVDCLHFCLSHDLTARDGDIAQILEEVQAFPFEPEWLYEPAGSLLDILSKAGTTELITPSLITLGKSRQYEDWEILEAYMEKNQENFRRLERGY